MRVMKAMRVIRMSLQERKSSTRSVSFLNIIPCSCQIQEAHDEGLKEVNHFNNTQGVSQMILGTSFLLAYIR